MASHRRRSSTPTASGSRPGSPGLVKTETTANSEPYAAVRRSSAVARTATHELGGFAGTPPRGPESPVEPRDSPSPEGIVRCERATALTAPPDPSKGLPSSRLAQRHQEDPVHTNDAPPDTSIRAGRNPRPDPRHHALARGGGPPGVPSDVGDLHVPLPRWAGRARPCGGLPYKRPSSASESPRLRFRMNSGMECVVGC